VFSSKDAEACSAVDMDVDVSHATLRTIIYLSTSASILCATGLGSARTDGGVMMLALPLESDGTEALSPVVGMHFLVLERYMLGRLCC
jgi:hypothetical protein